MIGRRGFGVVGMLALCTVLFGCAAHTKPDDTEPRVEPAVAMPADLRTAVQNAALCGRALYEGYASSASEDDAAVRTALETVREAVKDGCAGTYRALAVMPPGAPSDRIVVYYVGEVPRSQGLLVGRHYRVETTPNGTGILLGEPSTARCIVLPPAPPDSTAMRVITHLLSPAPNEFHVFLSIIDGAGFQVVTEAGRWIVEHGRISYLGRT